MKVFVDSNIPMYVAGADHPNRGPATTFLAEARAGSYDLCTSTEVLQEIRLFDHESWTAPTVLDEGLFVRSRRQIVALRFAASE